MSYDVTVGEFSYNYTSNVAALFHQHIGIDDKTGLQALHGMKASAAASALWDAFERIDDTRGTLWSQDVVGEPRFCGQYDSRSGWGSTVGALVFLGKILGACAVHADATVGVSA